MSRREDWPPLVVADVMSRVLTLKQAGLGILLVEQTVETAARLADHLTVLDVGRVVIDAPMSEIADLDRVKDACMGRLGDPPGSNQPSMGP